MGERGSRAALWLVAAVCIHCGPVARTTQGADPGPGPDLSSPPEVKVLPAVPALPSLPDGKAASCLPSAGDAVWVEEESPIEVQFRCTIASGEAGAVFEMISPLPQGARFDPQSGILRWTPSLDQAAVYELELRERHSGETGVLKLGVLDRWSASDNMPVLDPTRYTEEYGLPVMHLTIDRSISSEGYTPAQLVYRGHSYAIQAKYRGASSIEFPQKSFTLEFPDDDEFRDPLVGFGNRDKLVLITSFNDNSYVRPMLAFELWRRMDPNHLQVKTFPVVLFLNGSYWGLYTAADHVDSDLLRRHGLGKNGDLFKGVSSDANFSYVDTDGAKKSSLHEGFEKKEGLPPEGMPGSFAPIEALTRFVMESDDATFQAELGTRLHLRDYQDWWILLHLLQATDNAGKNAYHYVDTVNGGPFRYIPWDLDACLGQNWNTTRTSPTDSKDFGERNALLRRMQADPVLIGPARDRLHSLVRNELSMEVVLPVLDDYARQVHPSALRSDARWRSAYRSYKRWSTRSDFTTFEEELEYLRAWIETRWSRL